MSTRKLRQLSQRSPSGPSFDEALARHGLPPLTRGPTTTLQINVGKLCNMACHHCHVEAGPKRTEIMALPTVERLCELIASDSAIEVVDITGGAPELNPHFEKLVAHARRHDKAVIDRCNLSVLLQPGMERMAGFLASEGVRIVASLPCYQRGNVDKQRGKGAFDDSITALRLLNRLGYGRAPGLMLDLVYNPGGASLPPPQAQLELDYKKELKSLFDIDFNGLLTITNMPIKRFADMLEREGRHDSYMSLLVNHFNPATVDGVMCRSLVSVSWDGRLYDCDFNQMLELPLSPQRTIWDVASFQALSGAPVATGSHCLGCTAGAGSSCSGALS
jgi:radical SAM/Cys-rich protein